jgi:uncharacterized protein
MKQQQQPSASATDAVHNQTQSRYELHVDGQVAAFAQYRREGDTICFTHTEVDTAYEGQGLGSRLAASALDDVKSRGLKADPRCEFMKSYIQRHEKEYGELVV